MRINKYIAQSGLCSRRKADEYILSGRVKVNGNVIGMSRVFMGTIDGQNALFMDNLQLNNNLIMI